MVFAIESEITTAYPALGTRALGFFALHIGGLAYGVRSPDATLLACSLDEVERRLAERGEHTADFSREADGGAIADAVRDAIYAPGQECVRFFGIAQAEFAAAISAQRVIWAPDGDEAFDDSSYVLHFDVGDRTRLIGFRSTESYHHDRGTLRDVMLDAEVFYGVLREWRNGFVATWERRLETAKSVGGVSRADGIS